jgi:hypothetical protein
MMALAYRRIVFVVFVFAMVWASRYTKVGPNQVLVVSGRQYKMTDPDGTAHTRGFRIVKGGGTFVFPVIEKVDILSLELLTIDVQNARGLHEQRRAGESRWRRADQGQGRRHFHRHRPPSSSSAKTPPRS